MANQKNEKDAANKKATTGVFVDIKKVVDTYNRNNPELKQLTQKDLAEKADMSAVTLGNYNRGNGPVVLKQIMLMAELSGLDVKDFITIEKH